MQGLHLTDNGKNDTLNEKLSVILGRRLSGCCMHRVNQEEGGPAHSLGRLISAKLRWWGLFPTHTCLKLTTGLVGAAAVWAPHLHQGSAHATLYLWAAEALTYWGACGRSRRDRWQISLRHLRLYECSGCRTVGRGAPSSCLYPYSVPRCPQGKNLS